MSKIDAAGSNKPQRPLFSSPDVDAIALAVVTLTKELWVVKDRVRILEAVLAEKGVDVHEAVETFQPDSALQAELSAEGQALVERIASVLAQR